MAAIGHALLITGSMAWEITWALILGFGLSAIVQALVPKQAVVRLLGDDRPRTLAVAAGLGAASSSCSYAAVALARSLFSKGASFTAAMAFEIASTNLVVELGVILALLLGWQFTAAEFVGGPFMIIFVALAFRVFLRQRLLTEARAQSERGLAGSMEGHAAMDMSVRARGSLLRRLALRRGVHVGVARVRDGVGGHPARPGDRPAHRGRHRGLGAAGLLAGVLHHRAPGGRGDLGAAGGAGWWPCSASSARSATCRWPRCCGRTG